MDIIVEVEKKVLVNIDGGRGPKGDDGADGATGPKGDKGDTGPQGLPGSADITKTSDLINDGETGSPFITFEDLPSNISLFATNAVSDISGYLKLVSTLDDVDYNDVAVDINTGAITTSNQLIASLAASPNLFVGNPGIINITTLGEIRRISGTASALFYFELYKRTLAGVETLISTSNNTAGITNSVYEQFSTTALLNNGSFISTDRLVLKFYGSKVGGGSNPTFNFLFGGSNPVRTSIPVPLTAIPALTKADIGLGNVDNTSDVNKPISNDTQTALNLKVDKVAGERLINAAEITKLGNQSGVNTGDQNNHTLLTNLNSDDHTQYMLLSGRVGGQTLIGGTAASNNLTLSSTSNATKGSIIFGDSRYNESTNRLSFGTASGTGRINLPDGTTAADGIWFGSTSLFRSSLNTLTLGGQLVTSTSLLTNTITSITAASPINVNLHTGFNIIPNTLTGSSATSALSISQTWNTTGTPTAIDLNLTDTASNAASLFFNLRRNGGSVFSVRKTGEVSSLYQRFGSGSPEGFVAAPIGARYSRTDGGAGTSFYVKESGGNTSSGWVAK